MWRQVFANAVVGGSARRYPLSLHDERWASKHKAERHCGVELFMMDIS